MEIQAPSKRKMSKRAKIILFAFLAISLFVVASFFYVIIMDWIYSQPADPGPLPPAISAHRSSNATSWTWTITAIGSSAPVLKSDVYVYVRNASTGFIISPQPLTAASGTHGFTYSAVSSGNYISAGDVFGLSKAYIQGSTIGLVTPDVVGTYALLTV